MNEIEQIKAEIERLKEETVIGICKYGKGEENGRMEVLNDLLSFINALPEEKPSEDLEKAADYSWAEYEYRETPQGLYSSCYIDGFKAGAQWDREQVIGIIEKRIAEILGDGQPAPILRYELQDIIKRIKED